MTTKQESMKEGRNVERYIAATVCDEHCIDVTNDDSYPGVDFLIPSGKLDVKNAWNTENSSMIKARKINNVNHWFRLNKDQSTNWHNFFIPNVSLSEEGFCDFISAPAPSSLTNFFN